MQRAAVAFGANGGDGTTGPVMIRARILVVLANLGDLPLTSLPTGELSGVHVVLGNYDGATPASAWQATLAHAGAADVQVLPPALTDTRLPVLVGSQTGSSPT